MPSDHLSAIEEIKQLKARYFRYADTKNWEGFGEVFAPDATVDYTQAGPRGPDPTARAEGREAIVDFVRRSIGHVETVHYGHMPEIDIISPTTANGIWAMEDK